MDDPEVVHARLLGAGIDADSALEEAQSPTLAERLDADTRNAVECGCTSGRASASSIEVSASAGRRRPLARG